MLSWHGSYRESPRLIGRLDMLFPVGAAVIGSSPYKSPFLPSFLPSDAEAAHFNNAMDFLGRPGCVDTRVRLDRLAEGWDSPVACRREMLPKGGKVGGS